MPSKRKAPAAEGEPVRGWGSPALRLRRAADEACATRGDRAREVCLRAA